MKPDIKKVTLAQELFLEEDREDPLPDDQPIQEDLVKEVKQKKR